jgi:2-dehydro-3-deoxyphosphogalactonate aldolase
MNLAALLHNMPMIAILRGVRTDEVLGVCESLLEAGFKIIEIPLNSPDPIDSIALAAREFGERAMIGAGTVMHTDAVSRVRDAGGRLVVMPHSNIDVIEEAKHLGLACVPGAATPTEGFNALAAGADGIKLFPAEMLAPPVVKAWRAVFPPDALLVPVGGITPENMRDYWRAGANGFGIGSALYKPGIATQQLRDNARRFAAAAQALTE